MSPGSCRLVTTSRTDWLPAPARSAVPRSSATSPEMVAAATNELVPDHITADRVGRLGTIQVPQPQKVLDDR
jgi:hypothetical protein